MGEFIKPCHAYMYEGLDDVQFYYARMYGFEKEDVQYHEFTVMWSDGIGGHEAKYSHTVVTACCRAHARDLMLKEHQFVLSCTF